ncbi:MAG TPA: isoprenylcysteine carboxylmethyltransferase family protein, partial [Brevundimonas sp.]|nr:isoprenylcysteine carboxylmethyltransferase family protein [Brevundimonas sp.]
MSAVQGFDLQRVQKLRKLALLVGIIAVVALAFFTRSLGGGTALHEGLEAFGLALIAVCIVGRA